MTAIREWLETAGLGQYADLFEREQIDLDAVRHLTESNLKDLGLGVRRELAAVRPGAGTMTLRRYGAQRRARSTVLRTPRRRGMDALSKWLQALRLGTNDFQSMALGKAVAVVVSPMLAGPQ